MCARACMAPALLLYCAKRVPALRAQGPRIFDLSTAIPTIEITGPDVAVISEQDGKDMATFSFQSSMALKAWKVKLVPSNSSAQDAGTQIPTTGGSTNMSGTTLAANTAKECKINGSDLSSAAGGVDGTYIIKVFGQASANDLWSA